MRHLTLGAIAEIIGAKLEGDADYSVSGLATLASALPHQVSFLANMKYAGQLNVCQAGAVILNADQAKFFVGHCLLLDNPYLGYANFVNAISKIVHLTV